MGETKAEDDLDAYLGAVLIGGREEREIQIVDYSEEMASTPLRPRDTESTVCSGDSSPDRAHQLHRCAETGAKVIVYIMVTVEGPDGESA